MAVQGTLPDLVVLLDLSPEEAFKRVASRAGSDPDSFEHEKLDFHTRIRNGFLECANDLPVPFLVLDATKSPEELLEITALACGLTGQ